MAKKTRVKTASRKRVNAPSVMRTPTDLWANNVLLKAQQSRENDTLRAELQNQALEQRLILEGMKRDFERDRLYYQRRSDLGDNRATIALRDMKDSSVGTDREFKDASVGTDRRGKEAKDFYAGTSPEHRDSSIGTDLGGELPHAFLKSRSKSTSSKDSASPRGIPVQRNVRAYDSTSERLGLSRTPESVSAPPSARQSAPDIDIRQGFGEAEKLKPKVSIRPASTLSQSNPSAMGQHIARSPTRASSMDMFGKNSESIRRQ